MPLLHPKWLETIGGHVQSLLQATFIENQDVQTLKHPRIYRSFHKKKLEKAYQSSDLRHIDLV